jgi:hypothetical protein
LKNLYCFSLSLLCALLFWGSNGSKGFSQTLEQHISSDTLEAGDVFDFSIILKKDQPYDAVIYPDSSRFSDNFELRNRKIYRIAGFEDSLHYQVQFWGTSTDTLPALPVKLVLNGDTSVVHTQPVIIHFRSVLKHKDAKMRPLKPIFTFAAAWWPYLLGFLLLLIVIALSYYFYQKYKTHPEPEPAREFIPQPFLNPLKELENNLTQLKDVPLDNREQFERFYISLGDAIRLYFERMYNIPAMESTSREIVYELNRRAIDEKLIKQTRIVLQEADMVKFANFTPTKENARKTYHKAEDFLSIAQELHGPRIQQMRRQHLAKVEEERKKFQEEELKEEDS